MRTVPTGSRAVAVLIVVIGLFLLVQWLAGGSAAPGGAGESVSAASVGASTRGALPTAAQQSTDPASGLRWVDLSSLPPEASDTMDEIQDGPPYPFPGKDGVTYHNLNGVLPAQPDGYYHEFTVRTPGVSSRGARRIVVGGAQRGQANQEWYYTADHYETFVRIRP